MHLGNTPWGCLAVLFLVSVVADTVMVVMTANKRKTHNNKSYYASRPKEAENEWSKRAH